MKTSSEPDVLEALRELPCHFERIPDFGDGKG
jgi:hypothetical protein